MGATSVWRSRDWLTRRCLVYIQTLLDDIQFNKTTRARFAFRVFLDVIVVQPPHVSNVSQPVLQRASMVQVSQGGAYTTAVIMPTDDDVRYMQKLNCVLKN